MSKWPNHGVHSLQFLAMYLCRLDKIEVKLGGFEILRASGAGSSPPRSPRLAIGIRRWQVGRIDFPFGTVPQGISARAATSTGKAILHPTSPRADEPHRPMTTLTQRPAVPRDRTIIAAEISDTASVRGRGIGSAGLKDYNLDVGRGSFWKSVSPTTKIRHPEVRKRVSVFFSLRVGPKDLVLDT